MIEANEHPCNCTCDACIGEDITAILAAHPQSAWTWKKLEWIRTVRQRPLNWTLEPGHCVLCGGLSLSAWDTAEHDIVKAHNPKEVNGTTFLSLLVADGSGWLATYRYLSRLGKDRLRQWVADVHGIRPEFAKVIAIRKVEDWTELRVGFSYGN